MKQTFTAKQIADWRAYERVRQSGRFNMYDPRARRATKLDDEVYAFVMDHYSELREAAETDHIKPSDLPQKGMWPASTVRIINDGARQLHNQMAVEAGLKQATIRCEQCGKSQQVDGAKCLADGWPKCCGYTMRLVTEGES